jgi:hypothetical protein
VLASVLTFARNQTPVALKLRIDVPYGNASDTFLFGKPHDEA